MTTPIIDLIRRHASARHYKPDGVPQDLIEEIISAGQCAATSSNLQMYSVVVTLDAEKRRQMQAYCGNQKHISQAPAFLTWCVDLSRLERICRVREYSQEAGYVENFLLTVVDTVIAAQNAGLAAESLGLGFCYIGAIRNNPREVIQLLGLPRLTFPVVGMTLGWPAVQPKIRPRLPLDAILHWEQYDTSNEPAYLDQYDQEMIATGIYHGRQVSADDPAPESEYGWTEHSSRRVSQMVRPHLREVLEEMGFQLR